VKSYLQYIGYVKILFELNDFYIIIFVI
jgi:hypothetical protein